LSTYVKILGAHPCSARAVRVRDPAYTAESPIDKTEIQIVAFTRSEMDFGSEYGEIKRDASPYDLIQEFSRFEEQ
jgi:hypothetical protein